jgi:pimeloyl-ACP methyl ester carboxylesterase
MTSERPVKTTGGRSELSCRIGISALMDSGRCGAAGAPWPVPDRWVAAWVATIGIMLRPEVRYTRASDGVAIAYSVVGEGPVTIVVVSPLISQVELAWEEPALEHFWSRFAACARVVLFDRRGAGLSDRSPAAERLGLGALASDIVAVLDACDAGQAALFGVTVGCPVAVGFAASYPDRAQALVLAGGFAKLTRLGDDCRKSWPFTTTRVPDVAVPSVLEMTVAQARSTLAAAGLRVAVSSAIDRSCGTLPGRIMNQAPDAETLVQPNSVVKVVTAIRPPVCP